MKPFLVIFLLRSILPSTSSTNHNQLQKVILDNNNGSLLDFYMCRNGLKTGMTLQLTGDTEYIVSSDEFCIVQGIANVSIISIGDDQATIVCTGGSSDKENGFGFFNVTNVELGNLKFVGCGAEVVLPDHIHAEVLRHMSSSNLYIGTGQKAVLLFAHCYNSTLSSVTINGNFKGIGVLFIDTLGTTNIDRVTITDKLSDSVLVTLTNFSHAGGGAVFVYTDDTNNAIHSSPELVTLNISQSHFTRNNQAFSPNINILDFFSLNYPERVPVISAVGLALIIASNTRSLSASIDGVFIYNSFNTHIGAMLVLYYRTCLKHDIRLSNITVRRNLLIPTFSKQKVAAGITFVVSSSKNNENLLSEVWQHDEPSLVKISNATFSLNCGVRGIGISFVALPFSRVNLDFIAHQCTFYHNSGIESGTGMYFEVSPIKYENELGNNINVYLSKINATNNRFWSTERLESDKRYHYGTSVFSFINIPKVTFHTNNLLTFNNGSVIEIYNSVLEIQDTFICQHNIAMKGGCLLFKGLSYLKLSKSTSAQFSFNRALVSGGAIYGDSLGIPTDVCTIQPYNGISEQRYPVVFNGNHAHLDGNDIKITNIYDCWLFFNKKLQNYKTFQYRKIFHFNQNNTISGQAYIISHCNGVASEAKTVYSGQTVTVPVIIKDKTLNPISTSILVTPIGEFNISGEDYHSLYPRCNTLNFTLISNITQEFVGKLKLQCLGNLKCYFNYHVVFKPCPMGFKVSSEYKYYCKCSPFLQKLKFGITCEIDRTEINLPHLSWFGSGSSFNSSEAFSLYCPFPYCYTNGMTSFDSITSIDPLCRDNRTGIMCGQCKEGLSQVFGSYACMKCSNIWLLSIIMYLFFGLFIVLLLFYTKLTISTGLLGGIVFFANLSAISLHLDMLSEDIYTLPIRTLMASLNLNMGYSFCFYNGMNSITKTALQFAFPVYLWCLVFMLILASRCSVRLSNLIVGSSVQVLVSLIHLSFAKLLLTICDIFTSTRLWISSNSTYEPILKHVWYFDGSKSYFAGQHLALFCVSLLVLFLVILPYLIFTTVASFIGRCRSIRVINPFIDSFCGPYKTKYRYWFGVRQWVVTILYIVYASLRGSYPQLMFIINIAALFLFLTVQVALKPYKNRIVYIVDSAFIYILCVTDIVTFFYIKKGISYINQSSSIVISVFLTIYLLVVVSIVMFYCLIANSKTRKILMKFSKFIQSKLNKERPEVQSLNNDDIDYHRLPAVLAYHDEREK